MTAATAARVPDHVPKELVRDFDQITDAGLFEDPWKVYGAMHDGPEIFWATGQGGFWVLTRNDAIKEMMQNPADFSNYPAGIGAARFPLKMIPLESDPPEHAQYRNVVGRVLAPGAIKERTGQIEAVTHALIDTFVAAGECEFMEAIAKPLPTTIFTALMGLPLEESEKFLRWNHVLLHSLTEAEAQKGGMEIMGYLNNLIFKRRSEPQDDLVSALIQGQIDGRPLKHEEILGYCFLLFIAGLDTVTGALGYIAAHLAQHPEDQSRLREKPEQIGLAVEEFLRRYSIVNANRRVTRDLEFRGVQMKAGDFVLASTPLANLDPKAFECPHLAKLDRNPNPHMAFSYGPHRCMGSHLARAELVTLVRLFLNRVPSFRLKQGTVLRHYSGVHGLHSVPLVWSA